MVCGKYQPCKRDRLERLLELPLGEQRIASGDRLKHRRAGQVLAGQIGADIRETANQSRDGKSIVLQSVQADGCYILPSDESNDRTQISRFSVRSITSEQDGL